jgi:pimeloyl-ACP methyl ester carboxylesterase
MTVLGEGQPIVVLPMFRLDGAAMAYAFEPILSGFAGWRRIYVDLPGTGGSAPVAPNSDAVLDAVISATLPADGSPPIRIVGASYGGYLATGFARRFPTRIQGLFLIATGVHINPADRDTTGVLPSHPEEHWLDQVPLGLHEHLTHAVGLQTPEVAARITAALARRSPLSDDYLDALQSHGFPLSDEDDDRTYGGDVLIVAGRQDRIVGYRDQFATLSRYTHANYVAVEGTGHYLAFERPDILRVLARTWLH